jgi:hypothetical protein
MDDFTLVMAKEDFVTSVSEFTSNRPYRCRVEDKGCLVYGEFFTKKEFKEKFSFLLDIVKEEWDIIGLTNNGIALSKSAFKVRANEGHNKYGRHLHVFFFYVNAKQLMYGFYPSFQSTKVDALNDAYDNYKNILNNELDALDTKSDLIQRGNSGIPFSYRDIYWKKSNEDWSFQL